MPMQLVGTRSRAIRRRTSKNGANLKTGQADGQEPQLRERKSGFAEAAKRSVETCSAGRAGAHPYRRRRSGEWRPIVLRAEDQICRAHRLPYPLTAPPTVPLARYFCTKNPSRIIGTIVIVAAALLFPQSTEIEPTNFEIPTGNV